MGLEVLYLSSPEGDGEGAIFVKSSALHCFLHHPITITVIKLLRSFCIFIHTAWVQLHIFTTKKSEDFHSMGESSFLKVTSGFFAFPTNQT